MNEDKYLTREEFQQWCNQWYEKYDKDREEDRKRWEEYRVQEAKKWEEHRLEEAKKWEEHRLEEAKKWEEHRLEEAKKWEEHRLEEAKKWEEHKAEIKQLREDFERKWWENQKNIERILRRLDKHDQFLGIGVEGIAAMLLQPYIEDKYKIKLKNGLRKTLLNLNGKTVEVNLFGEGKKVKGKKKYVVWIECKSTIGERNVKGFLKKLKIGKSFYSNRKVELIKIVFGNFIHPSALSIARKHNIQVMSNVPHTVEARNE